MIPQLNIEKIFLFIYDVILGGEYTFEFDTLARLWGQYTFFAMIVSFIFAAWLVYALIRKKQIITADKERFYARAHAATAAPQLSLIQEKWAEVTENIASDNPGDWRLAILEADILLDDVLVDRGYSGETMGDRLKQAGFATINQAWEAHKVRNEIAHSGSNYQLTEREARRVIDLYRQVLEDLNVL